MVLPCRHFSWIIDDVVAARSFDRLLRRPPRASSCSACAGRARARGRGSSFLRPRGSTCSMSRSTRPFCATRACSAPSCAGSAEVPGWLSMRSSGCRRCSTKSTVPSRSVACGSCCSGRAPASSRPQVPTCWRAARSSDRCTRSFQQNSARSSTWTKCCDTAVSRLSGRRRPSATASRRTRSSISARRSRQKPWSATSPGSRGSCRLAALFHGQVINVAGLARDAGVARTTVSGYLEILADTHLASLSACVRGQAARQGAQAPRAVLDRSGRRSGHEAIVSCPHGRGTRPAPRRMGGRAPPSA